MDNWSGELIVTVFIVVGAVILGIVYLVCQTILRLHGLTLF